MRKRFIVLGAIALVALGAFIPIPDLGWPGLGGLGKRSNERESPVTLKSNETPEGALVIVVEGDQYLVNGKSQSLAEAVASAEHAPKVESGSSNRKAPRDS
jgi:hypothetical protein